MNFLDQVNDDATLNSSNNNVINSNDTTQQPTPTKEQIIQKFRQYNQGQNEPIFSLEELENLTIGGKKLVRDNTATDDWELKIVPFDAMDKYIISSMEVKSKFFENENKISKFVIAKFTPLLINDGTVFIAKPITWKLNWKSSLQVGDMANIKERCWGYLINKKTNQVVTSII